MSLQPFAETEPPADHVLWGKLYLARENLIEAGATLRFELKTTGTISDSCAGLIREIDEMSRTFHAMVEHPSSKRPRGRLEISSGP
ncbi:hypothetical protein GCM10010922_02980 [Microbacterium sorbitolivorans]|uniref:Uncharacterized protein n=1 Tax=Microbacterium sorbitolivorans TaxID=1867410 RepID=A0A367Y7C3_9MICO|nr:hypothetical protein [Microbacterium sorbitolivorans]RCK61539.1 hypothetical protein DTO57_02575 [Microbacterium sorbitolivorans]GGF31325.1 hypothetical protein GCM10010922_02980 [Microbacterium sorbitolivorans]